MLFMQELVREASINARQRGERGMSGQSVRRVRGVSCFGNEVVEEMLIDVGMFEKV